MSKVKKLIPELRFPEFSNEEEWYNNDLGEIAEIVRGGSPRPIQEYLTTDKDGLNWLKIADVPSDSKYITGTKERVIQEAINSTREVNPGDLILSNSMSFGRPYILKIKSCIHDGWIAIRKISDKTFEDYLYYFISSESSQKYFQVNAAGAAVKNLNAEIIKLLPIYLPKEKDEQRKIASCLSSLDELIDAYSDKLEAVQDHKKGLMQNLFPQEGKKVPNYRFPEFENDGEWVKKTIEDMCQVNPSVGDLPNEFVYVDLESVSNGVLLKKNVIFKEGAPSRAQRLLKDKDVIYQMVRPYQKNNYYFLANDECEFVASTGYAQLRAFESSKFLFQLIHTDRFVSSVLNKCTGSNYPAINSSALKQIEIQVPTTKEEQEKIASCLSAVDELITAQKAKIEQLQQHKKGLMQGLFPKIES